MRLNRIFSWLIVCLTTIAGFGLVLSSLVAGGGSTQITGTTTAMPMSDSFHVLGGGFWRVDGGFVSTIRIKNILVIAPIQVTPTLYMADGTAYTLAPVTVPVSGVATININDALVAAPQAIASHISQFGSLTLLYQYPTPGHLIAAVSAIDAPRSLSFGYMINEAMVMPNDNGQKVFEGLWWKHDPGVHGTIILSNTTDQSRTATLRVTRKGGDLNLREVNLPPLTTQVLDLKEVSSEIADESNVAGGVRVEFNGPTGAIMVTGNLINESEGYSANMPFSSQASPIPPAQVIKAGSTGILVGKPDPMMMPGLPAQTHFIPYLALRNTTAAEMDVSLTLNYMAGTAPAIRSLRTQRLGPFQSRMADLGGMLDEAGLNSFNGTINLAFTYTGRASDVIMATGSVDQTGTYVFEVTSQGIAENNGSIAGYWSFDDGNDTMFNLWNPTDVPQEILATLYYGDGSGAYKLPIHLSPQASTMIDIGMLIREETPDIDGKIIPPNVREGSASFGSAANDLSAYDGKKRITVIISGGVFNTANATCGVTWTYCNGYNNFVISPSSPFLLVGGSTQLQTQATDSYGNIHTMSNGAWSSSNTAAFTVSGGNLSAVGPGTSTISDLFYGVIVVQGQYCVGEGGNDTCPTSTEGGTTVATAAPSLTSLSPALGAKGATTPVTLYGTGFGSVCANVAIAAGSGITVNCTSASSTQIQANFVVSSSAAAGIHSVNVTVNSETSNNMNFFVQIPAKLVFFNTSCAPYGQGALQPITNGNVVDCGGVTHATSFCGVNRNLTYQLTDANGNPFPLAYTLSESFSNLSTTNSALGLPTPSTNVLIPANGYITDAQYVGFKYPACLGSNDHHSYNQQFSVVVGGTTYNLSTIVLVSDGNFSGTTKDDVTITTP